MHFIAAEYSDVLFSPYDDIELMSYDLDSSEHLHNLDVLCKIYENKDLVDIKELQKVLKEQKISGAVLDVFENEPLEKDSPLWDMDNVIITPHNSFVSEQNSKRLSDVIIKNLESREQK